MLTTMPMLDSDAFALSSGWVELRSQILKNLNTRVKRITSLLKNVHFNFASEMEKTARPLQDELAEPAALVFPGWNAI